MRDQETSLMLMLSTYFGEARKIYTANTKAISTPLTKRTVNIINTGSVGPSVPECGLSSTLPVPKNSKIDSKIEKGQLAG